MHQVPLYPGVSFCQNKKNDKLIANVPTFLGMKWQKGFKQSLIHNIFRFSDNFAFLRSVSCRIPFGRSVTPSVVVNPWTPG